MTAVLVKADQKVNDKTIQKGLCIFRTFDIKTTTENI